MEIEIRLFGAFRKYSEDNPFVRVEFSGPKSIAEIKKHLYQEIFKNELVFDSRLATDDTMLEEDHLVSASCRLAILPPVSGG